ncbi:MAG: SagB/ThcOx family dehydrogenase [Firmicutes bacterium]|jgi:SagB-type dehydrogenase family enzyme|nr:SagB/ThcOx family dehydrogenase [Bacillota bacterium]
MGLPEEDLFSISEIYHENTKERAMVLPLLGNVPRERGPWHRAFKKYPHRNAIRLEKPVPGPSPGFEETARRRRSIRDFSGDPISLDELARLLYFSNGITGSLQSGDSLIPLRASPSAGALYPIEVYPFVAAVSGIEQGVYHYEVEGHALEHLRSGSFSEDLYEYTHRQEMVRKSSVVFVMTAMFGRTKVKYGERGYRYVLLDAGHLAQNLYLESTALGLGCATVGGFLDDEVNGLLGVDGLLESAVYVAVVGRPVGPCQCAEGPGEIAERQV